MRQFLGLQPETLHQLADLTLAFVLSALLGVEREIRQKSAGLRTHTLVGVAAALFMLISKFGFNDILAKGTIVLDPSRVAAQIVSGIGFIGGGVIFMRRDVVRGLTTASSIWFAAALGMACGAGQPLLAAITTIGFFAIMLGFPLFERKLPKSKKLPTEIQVSYQDGRGLLRTILVKCTALRFSIDRVGLEQGTNASLHPEDQQDEQGTPLSLEPMPGQVTLTMLVRGKRPISHLITALGAIEGVHEVGITETGTPD